MRKHLSLLTMLAVAVLSYSLLPVSALSGATLLDYTFSGDEAGNTYLNPDDSAANLSGSAFSAHADTSGNATEVIAFPTYNTQGWDSPTGAVTVATQEWSMASYNEEGDYLSFTLTVDSGYQVALSSLDFWSNSLNSSGPQTLEVRYSGDSFASSLLTKTRAGSGNTEFRADDLDPDMSNSAITLTDTGVTGDVEFRFYAYDPSGGGGNAWRIDDITLQGEVTVIPEPSAMVLLLGSLAVGLTLRRRRR